MTVKTVLQISDASFTVSSDMTRRSAVKKNLFGTTVDRDELRQHTKQMLDESNKTLQGYRPESVLGLIKRSNMDRKASKSGKLKRLLLCSDDSDSYESEHSGKSASDEASTMPSSSTHAPTPSSTNASSSDKASKVLVNQDQQTLSRRQKTIKDYFPVSKRTRQDR